MIQSACKYVPGLAGPAHTDFGMIPLIAPDAVFSMMVCQTVPGHFTARNFRLNLLT